LSDHSLHPHIGALTRNTEKAALYSRETFFRESFHDFQSILGNSVEENLLAHGMVILKPDGYQLGLTGRVLDFYVSHGFELAAAAQVYFTPLLWRTMWTYQMSQASLDRLAVNDLVMTGQGLALFLRHDPFTQQLPAAVRISHLKGPAKAEEQMTECLRRHVQQPNRIFSLVHSADDPADLVRETAILFDQSQRRALARSLRQSVDEKSLNLVAQARRLEGHPTRSFSVEDSSSRLLLAIETQLDRARLAPALADQLRAIRRDFERLNRLELTTVVAALREGGVRFESWDLAVVASSLIGFDEPGAQKVIDNLGPAVWTSVGQFPHSGSATQSHRNRSA
jgi:nucleoside diphosphate kinase